MFFRLARLKHFRISALVTVSRSAMRLVISLQGSRDDCPTVQSDFITFCLSSTSSVLLNWLSWAFWMAVTAHHLFLECTGSVHFDYGGFMQPCNLVRLRPSHPSTLHTFGVTQHSGQVGPRPTPPMQVSVVPVHDRKIVGLCHLFRGATGVSILGWKLNVIQWPIGLS